MNSNSASGYIRDYLDFDIEIREGELRGYAVAVRSPAGEAQENMSFPFDERQLRDKLKDLEIALLRSGGTRRALSTEERTVQEFGRSLFEAVLIGKVGTCYYRSMDQAQQQGKGLRLKLHVKPPNLTVLPWEFLYDPDRDEYLCFSRDTPIVRYTDLRQPIGRLTVAPPLRILGMVASPRDLDPLDVEHEKGLMDEAVEDLQADGLIKLTWLEGETWRDLQRVMRRDGPWHIFHFVGHGDFDLSAQEGLIAFSEKGTGRRHLLRSRDLARLLDGHPSLRLVFLNSCEGARGSEGDPFSGTAATLVRRGIPAVVAMQYQITDKAAIEFSSAFYESLADGLPVDAAVTEARVAVSMDSMLEWGTPVLYMRSPDGSLFDISTSTSPSEQPLGVTGQEEQRERQEQADDEIERRNKLGELYGLARRSHQKQDWQEVIDVFEHIRSEDPTYPDSEGLLVTARDALERMQKVTAIYAQGQRHMDAREWQRALECFEEVQRLEPGYQDNEAVLSQVRQELEEGEKASRYREALESAWADGELDNDEAESLIDLANYDLGLNPRTAVDIEHEVIGDTIDGILERQKQVASEQDRKRRLNALYRQARQSHQAQDWQAVVDLFAQIHSEDPRYLDNEGLLVSAREALEIARREDTLRQYREAVEETWADKRVSYAEAERLGALVNELGLSTDTVAGIEHRIIGATKEALLGRQKGTVKWFSDEKGYGFISPDDGSEDIFVYLSDTAGNGSKYLTEGADVTYEVRQYRTGPQATNVRRVDPLN